MSTQPQLSPLEQLGQSVQQSSPQQNQNATPSQLSPLEQLGQSVQQNGDTPNPSQTGELTNDVGQKVIVPKDGESFADTMKRAVQYHNSLTPEQQQAALNAETATIPKKTAQTLGAAATTGVVGPAVLAVPGEIADVAIKHLAGNVLPGMESEAAKQAIIHALPKALEFAKAMSVLGMGAGGVTYLLKTLMGDSKK